MAGLNDPLTQLDYGEQFIRGPQSTTQMTGLAGLAAPANVDIARANQATLTRMRDFGGSLKLTQPQAPAAAPQGPVLAISRSTGKMWVNGKLFNKDDAQSAIESEQFVGGTPASPPPEEAADWEPLDPEAYNQYLTKIKNPSLTTLASKNFGIGVDTMQMLGGYGAQFLGATEFGQGVVRQQLEDIRKNAPYQRSLEDVPERGAVEWLVANVAQQGPNLIESIVTAAVGAGVGAAAGGGANPFTAVGGAMSAMVGKQAFKKAIMIAVQKQARGEALDAAEEKLLKEATGMTLAATKTLADDVSGAYGGKAILNQLIDTSAGARQQAMTGGAALFSTGQNYMTGVADLYGESVEGGTPNRAMAALAAVPYAAAETLPEYVAALRFFGGFKMRALKAGGKAGRAGTIATNVGIGAGAGAGLEGTTEAFQETLGIGMNADLDIDSPEGVSRLLNAFAAGAAIGGFVGAGSSLNTGKATDLLSAGTKPAEQGGTTLTSTPEAPPSRYISMPPTAAPTAAQPQGEMFPGTPMGTPPAQVPTGPMQPTAAPGGQIDMFADYQPPPFTPGEPSFIGPEARPLRSALSQVAADSLPGAQPPGAMMLRRGTGGSALAQAAAMQGPAMPMPGAPTYAQPSEINPQGELFPGAPMGVQFRAPATPQELPPSADVGGMQLALQPQREPEPPAPPRNAMTDRLAQLRRQMEFEQAQQQAAGTRVTPAEQVYDEALLNQPIVLDTEGASTGKNKLTDDGRRRIIAGFNTLDKPQQDAILVEFDNDETKLLDYVRRTSPPVVRKQFSALAKVEPKAFEVKVPKAAAPQAAAQPIIEETASATPELQVTTEIPADPREVRVMYERMVQEQTKRQDLLGNKTKLAAYAKKRGLKSAEMQRLLTDNYGAAQPVVAELERRMASPEFAAQEAANKQAASKIKFKETASATQVGQVEQGRQLKRPKDRGRLAKGREDRNVPAQVQEAGGQAGRRNFLAESRAKAEAAKPEPVSPKAEGVAAPSEKAKEPGTAVAVVEPKKIVDPEIDLVRGSIRNMDEWARLAESTPDAAAEVDNLIVALNVAEPKTQDYYDALDALLGYAKDSSVGKTAQNKAREHLTEEVDAEDIKIAERRLRGESVTDDDTDFNFITTTIDLFNSGQISALPSTLRGRLLSAWKRIKSKGMKIGEVTVADGSKKDIPVAAYIKGGPQFFNIKNGKIVPEGYFSISQWDSPDSPVPAGRIKLIIQKFTSKLAVKPKVYAFRNQADLKASDPKLYTKMRAGRAVADFDTAVAAGYSLDDTVIIFSDRIGSEDHLAFVLAHETLGHFGFRGLMGNNDFNILMDKLYNSDPRLRAVADISMSIRNLPKSEAVEEYLADYAAQLNTRLVLRFWNGVKSTLNRVGIKFGDEATRYLLSQSRRYVRTGQKSGVFETSSVMNRLWAVEHGQVGRFSVADFADSNRAIADAVSRDIPFIPRNMQDAAGKLMNYEMSWDKFRENFFSLFNYQSMRNPGLYEFRRLTEEMAEIEQGTYNRYRDKLAVLFDRNEADKLMVSKALMEGRIIASNRLLNKPFTANDRKDKLFTYDPVSDELLRLPANIKKFMDRGTLKYKELRDGTTFVREYTGADQKTYYREETFAGFKDLTEEQYKDYETVRQAMAEVEVDLLEAEYRSLLHTKATVSKAITRLLKTNKAQGALNNMVDKAAERHRELFEAELEIDPRGLVTLNKDALGRANDFLAAVNKALISADAKNDPEVRAFFENQKQADDFLANLGEFRADRKVPDNDLTYLFQNQIKQYILESGSFAKEEEKAKRTIAGGYIPFDRRGKYEIRLEAVDDKGNPVRLHEDHKRHMVYSQVDNIADAKKFADTLAGYFKDQTAEVLVQQSDGDYKAQTVRVRARYGEAITQGSADPALDVDNLLYGIRLLGIKLTPREMENLIKTTTEVGNPLRKRLQFADVPGVNKTTGIYVMAKHIQARGATIAKVETRPRMRDLMDLKNADSRAKWSGNSEQVMAAYNAWKSQTDPEYKKALLHDFEAALYMFRNTVPGAKNWDGSRAQYDKLKDGWQQTNMNRFYNTAQGHMKFMQDNTLVSESDFNMGTFVGKARGYATVIQLSIALSQAVMNLASVTTNWMPAMMSRSAKNAFGGGFSVGAVLGEYQRAMMHVGFRALRGGEANFAGFYEKMLDKPAELIAAGLTREEAAFIAAEIRDGKLMPAQSNAMLSAARNEITNKYFLKAVDVIMSPFNLSEQASRRAAALAGFRLMHRRLANSNMSQEERVQKARDFSIEMVSKVLGDYSAMNRPPAFRDGLPSLLLMYKTFAITTIQTLSRMDYKGKAIMLGALWFFAGVEGFPFAEDLEDLLDTIMQTLGLTVGSVRAEFIKAVEGVAPGLSPTILKGFVNGVLGLDADVAAKFSMGDFFPGTGVLLAGATVTEELKDIAGPMPAALLGTVTFARDLITMPFSSAVSFQDALRGSPMTGMRMVGDSWAYLDNGAIVDKRGYVVSPEMGMGVVAARLLGFYPRAAAEQYDAIRLAKRISNYQKEMTVYYRYPWVKAYKLRDNATMRQIEREVEEWNKSAKGTGLEIRDFPKNSLRAAKEASMSATQRTLRSSSKAAREDLTTLTDYLIQ